MTRADGVMFHASANAPPSDETKIPHDFEPCPTCRGTGKVYPEHLRGEIVAMDTVPGFDPRVPCPECSP